MEEVGDDSEEPEAPAEDDKLIVLLKFMKDLLLVILYYLLVDASSVETSENTRGNVNFALVTVTFDDAMPQVGSECVAFHRGWRVCIN